MSMFQGLQDSGLPLHRNPVHLGPEFPQIIQSVDHCDSVLSQSSMNREDRPYLRSAYGVQGTQSRICSTPFLHRCIIPDPCNVYVPKWDTLLTNN